MLQLRHTPRLARDHLLMARTDQQQIREHRYAKGLLNPSLVLTDLVFAQPEVRLQLAIDLFHLPDIMPPKVEAFTRYISRPRHRYATCSLWRCPRCLSYASPLPASKAGALAYPCRIASRYHIPLTIGSCQYREKIPS